MMKRISRGRPLTPEEAAKYRQIREQIAAEGPELMESHQERLAVLEQFHVLFEQLAAARAAWGMSLTDLSEATGMDGTTLSKLEAGQEVNPTLATLARYAEAVGKRLVVTLEDATTSTNLQDN